MNLLPDEVKDYSLAAPDKINIEKISDYTAVNMLLKFSSEGRTMEYKIDSVKIGRVY
jgi:hypothetical protein